MGFRLGTVGTLGPLDGHTHIHKGENRMVQHSTSKSILLVDDYINKSLMQTFKLPPCPISYYVSRVTGSQMDSFLTERFQQTDTCT